MATLIPAFGDGVSRMTAGEGHVPKEGHAWNDMAIKNNPAIDAI